MLHFAKLFSSEPSCCRLTDKLEIRPHLQAIILGDIATTKKRKCNAKYIKNFEMLRLIFAITGQFVLGAGPRFVLLIKWTTLRVWTIRIAFVVS